MDVPFPARFTLWLKAFRFKPLGALLRAWGAFPVNRGGSDRAALETAMQHLQAGQLLGIFIEVAGTGPAGKYVAASTRCSHARSESRRSHYSSGFDWHRCYRVPPLPPRGSGDWQAHPAPGRRKSHKELYQELGVEITRVIGELKKSLPER